MIDAYSFLDPRLTPVNAGPPNYANLIAWYLASDFDMMPHGSEVMGMSDHSPNPLWMELFAIGTTSGTRPTVARNSINSYMTSIAFAATRGLRSNQGANILTSKTVWTAFLVVKPTTRATEQLFLNFYHISNEMRIAESTATSGLFQTVYGNIANYPNTAMVSLNSWHYITLVNNSGTVTFNLDGALSLAYPTNPGTPASIPTDIQVGENFNNIITFTGNLAEFGVYDRALASDEITGLHQYFQQRYGLA